MADWVYEVAKILMLTAKNNPRLAKDIRIAVKQIEKKPSIGTLTANTRRVYTDPQNRFRIGYNYHPKSKEIEIAVLNILI